MLQPAGADFIVLYRQYGPYRETAGIVPSAPALGSPRPNPDGRSVCAGQGADRVAVGAGRRKVQPDVVRPATPVVVVASPWPADPVALRESLPQLLDAVTIGDEPVIEGLINVNLAPRAVLMAVPGIDVMLADRIVATRGRARLARGCRPAVPDLAADRRTGGPACDAGPVALPDLPRRRGAGTRGRHESAGGSGAEHRSRDRRGARAAAANLPEGVGGRRPARATVGWDSVPTGSATPVGTESQPFNRVPTYESQYHCES